MTTDAPEESYLDFVGNVAINVQKHDDGILSFPSEQV